MSMGDSDVLIAAAQKVADVLQDEAERHGWDTAMYITALQFATTLIIAGQAEASGLPPLRQVNLFAETMKKVAPRMLKVVRAEPQPLHPVVRQ
jgi:hypothetical protein